MGAAAPQVEAIDDHPRRPAGNPDRPRAHQHVGGLAVLRVRARIGGERDDPALQPEQATQRVAAAIRSRAGAGFRPRRRFRDREPMAS